MIKIGDSGKEFILDLNEIPYDEHELHIDSKASNGRNLPWGIEFVNNSDVLVEKNGDSLSIKLDHNDIDKKTIISLKNYAKERVVIEILPNNEALIPKVYDFKITNKSIVNNELVINLVSTANDKPQPWRCAYAGNPLSYKLSKSEGDGSCEITIKLLTELLTEFKSKLIFKQEKSEKEIELILYNDKDGIKKAD